MIPVRIKIQFVFCMMSFWPDKKVTKKALLVSLREINRMILISPSILLLGQEEFLYGS